MLLEPTNLPKVLVAAWKMVLQKRPLCHVLGARSSTSQTVWGLFRFVRIVME